MRHPVPIAIADVQSGSVSVAIALAHANAPLEIVSAGRSDLSFEDRTNEASIAALSDQLGQASAHALDGYRALQQSHGPVAQVYAVINAPWCHSQTIRMSKKLAEETTITKDIIDSFAAHALKECTDVDAEHILEAGIIRTELNGYPTNEPLGKRAQRISMYALVSDCDPRAQAAITDDLRAAFPAAHEPIFRSQLRTVLTVTHSLPPIPRDYCFVDIGRETTTIANIHGGLSMAHASLDEGLRTIIRRIAPARLPEETLALLKLAADETCQNDACTEIRAARRRIEPELVRNFGAAMTELVASRYLPSTLVLVCEDALAPWLTELLERIDFSQFTTTTRSFDVKALTPDIMRDLVTVPESIKGIVSMRVALAGSLAHIESDT